MESPSEKKLWKSVKIWQNYGHEFLAHPVVRTEKTT